MDTDKLKRLAEDLEGAIHQQDEYFLNTENCQAILALIADNERLLATNRNMQALLNDTVSECDALSTERDEAVAMLWRAWRAGRDMSEWREVAAFLARIDTETQEK